MHKIFRSLFKLHFLFFTKISTMYRVLLLNNKEGLTKLFHFLKVWPKIVNSSQIMTSYHNSLNSKIRFLVILVVIYSIISLLQHLITMINYEYFFLSFSNDPKSKSCSSSIIRMSLTYHNLEFTLNVLFTLLVKGSGSFI